MAHSVGNFEAVKYGGLGQYGGLGRYGGLGQEVCLLEFLCFLLSNSWASQSMGTSDNN